MIKWELKAKYKIFCNILIDFIFQSVWYNKAVVVLTAPHGVLSTNKRQQTQQHHKLLYLIVS